MSDLILRSIATLHDAITEKKPAKQICPACDYGTHCDPAYNDSDCVCPCHGKK